MVLAQYREGLLPAVGRDLRYLDLSFVQQVQPLGRLAILEDRLALWIVLDAYLLRNHLQLDIGQICKKCLFLQIRLIDHGLLLVVINHEVEKV